MALHRRAGVLGPMARDRAYKLAQKVEETVLVLTEVWFVSKMPRSVVVGEVWGAGRGGACGGGRSRGAPGRLIHQGGPCGPYGDVQGVRRAG